MVWIEWTCECCGHEHEDELEAIVYGDRIAPSRVFQLVCANEECEEGTRQWLGMKIGDWDEVR